MILDWKRFTPGEPLQPGTLWVAEQIPHLIVCGDQTQALAWGYWPSYNVPFYAEVRASWLALLQLAPWCLLLACALSLGSLCSLARLVWRSRSHTSSFPATRRRLWPRATGLPFYPDAGPLLQ